MIQTLLYRNKVNLQEVTIRVQDSRLIVWTPAVALSMSQIPWRLAAILDISKAMGSHIMHANEIGAVASQLVVMQILCVSSKANYCVVWQILLYNLQWHLRHVFQYHHWRMPTCMPAEPESLAHGIKTSLKGP